MALDELAVTLYRAADTSTLLGLLPVIRKELERASMEMRNMEGAERELRNTDAEIAEKFSELLATLDAKVGNPKEDENLKALREKFSYAMAQLGEHDQDAARHFDDMFRYIVDLTERERWIINELKRRGYLPLFPGEQSID